MIGFAKLFTTGLLGSQMVWAATGYTHNRQHARSLERRWTSENDHVTVDGSVCTVQVGPSSSTVMLADDQPLGGGEDDGPNLLYAFDLCGSYALINLPGYYTVNTVLQTNLTNVEIRLTGAISYVPDIEYWSPASIYMTYVSRSCAYSARTALILSAKRDDVLVLQRRGGDSPWRRDDRCQWPK